jgi:hypothetical protein
VYYYYESVNRINTHYDIMMSENLELIHTTEEIFDFHIFDEYLNPLTDEFHEPISSPKSVVIDSKRKLFLINQLEDQKRRTMKIIWHINYNTREVKRYIDLFEKEVSK